MRETDGMKKNVVLHTLLLLLASTAPAYAQTSGPLPGNPFGSALYGALAITPLRYLLQHYRKPRDQQSKSASVITAYIALGLFTAAYIIISRYALYGWLEFYKPGYKLLLQPSLVLLDAVLACQLADWAFTAQLAIFRIWSRRQNLFLQAIRIAAGLSVAAVIWALYFIAILLLTMPLKPFLDYDYYTDYLSNPSREAAELYANTHRTPPSFEGMLSCLYWLLGILGILAVQPVRYLWKHRGPATEQVTRDYWRIAAWAWLGLLAIGYAFMFIRVLLVYRVLG